MRPVPYVHLPTPDDWCAFWRVAYAQGYTWDGSSISHALDARRASYCAFAKRHCVIWVGHSPLRSLEGASLWSKKPFVQLNSAAQLLSYMRETDRLKERHA